MANDHDLEKYSRQIILNEIGPEGQEKIKRVSILVVGAGGLGSSAIKVFKTRRQKNNEQKQSL